MKKQHHIAVSAEFKSFVQDTKADHTAPSKTKTALEMSEREFCDAVMAFHETLSDNKKKEFKLECDRTMALRETRTRNTASVAQVEKLQAQRDALVSKLRENGMDEETIASIIGDEEQG